MSERVLCSDVFFFYGLLRKGAASVSMHIDLANYGQFLDAAYMRGDLYSLGDYPGIVEGEGMVKGILYRLDDLSLLPLLDEFEDVVPDNPKASLYLRIRKPLLTESGTPTGQTAWVYWYNQSIAGCAKLTSGEWPLEAR